MSGMIRAFKNGDASFNNRRVRSLSGGSSNGSSSASEEGKSDLKACVVCLLKAISTFRIDEIVNSSSWLSGLES